MFPISEPLWFENGPLDGVDADGKPWIRDDIKFLVKTNQQVTAPGGSAPSNRPHGKGQP